MSAQIIQFVPRANLNRDQLIEQARANYESIFPSLIQDAQQFTQTLIEYAKSGEPKESA